MGLAIEVCNNREKVDLLKYEVSIAGLKDGRSTEFRLYEEFGSTSGRSDFKSDIIVKPKSCETVVWTGEFLTYDRYDVRLVSFMNEWDD